MVEVFDREAVIGAAVPPGQEALDDLPGDEFAIT
jgi:hypothetical protein